MTEIHDELHNELHKELSNEVLNEFDGQVTTNLRSELKGILWDELARILPIELRFTLNKHLDND